MMASNESGDPDEAIGPSEAVGPDGEKARADDGPSGESEESGTSPGDGGDTERCPVVAVGASAGGLAALSEFFSAVPRDSGLAYVVIQHIAPQGSSALPELLGHHTDLEVEAVVDGRAVEADRVYVIPPGT